MLADGYTYSVLIVSSVLKVTEYMRNLLSEPVFAPIISVTSAGEAKRLLICSQYDLIIINTPLSDEFGSQFAIDIAQSARSGILILVKGEYYEQVAYSTENEGILTLEYPNSRAAIYQSIKLLIATRERLKKLEKKYDNLQDKMTEIRIVNRAKWLLIECSHMTEPQAHRHIEKQAMDLRKTRREVAESIINSYKQQ